MGSSLWPARQSNPKGFFEDKEVNQINEDILDGIVSKKGRLFGLKLFDNQPKYWDRWLLKLPPGKKFPFPPPPVIQRIRRLTKKVPFCFKDPRFCYTLPVWRPYLKNTRYICVFREPYRTAGSMVRESHEVKAFGKTVNLTFGGALKVWKFMYGHVVEIHQHTGDWLFLHYNQVVYGNGMDRLQGFTGASLDGTFVDPSLSRSRNGGSVSREIEILYGRLCSIAGYTGG
jgi:hypothetical protein